MEKHIWLGVMVMFHLAACNGGAPVDDKGYLPYSAVDIWPEEVASEVLAEPELGHESSSATPCEGPEDCLSGLCLHQEGVCAEPCDEECPEGTSCRPWLAAAPDVIHLCLPHEIPFCRPCLADGACQRFEGDGDVFCASSLGGAGSFCTTGCEVPGDCPEGHSCSAAGVCRPPADCDCLAWGDNHGYVTNCEVTNGFGTCSGERSCLESGMSKCAAPVPAEDICDGIDNDCDGGYDEAADHGPCELPNEHGTCLGTWACLSGKPVCSGTSPSPEACDGVDNDCDGEVDEGEALGCSAFFFDADGDGFGGLAGPCSCQAPPGAVANDLDCNDANSLVHPVGNELCDGVDNDCDGVLDEGCDVDGDGYCNVVPILWGDSFPCVSEQVDCNDDEPLVHPQAAEACDGMDNDCNGVPDEGCDMDGDGYCGQPAVAWGAGKVCEHGELDCDDDEPTVHPGAEDGCNARDDDCNGLVDDGCDLDGDGYCPGVMPEPLAGCADLAGPPAYLCVMGFMKKHCPKGFSDCNDNEASVNPGVAEICDNLDNDCDGVVDGGLDGDGDGFCAGPDVGPGCKACPLGGGDCADDDAAINPAAKDLPDLAAQDTNCDGLDGSIDACVFVDGSNGHDYQSGTPVAPKATIGAALDEVGVDPERNCVLVVQGTYVEPGLTILPGVHVWGGYQAGTYGVAPGVRSTLHGGRIGLRMKGSGGAASVGRMVVKAANATGFGKSSIGISVSGLQDALLADLEVFAGAGSGGKKGSSGSTGKAGSLGANGSKGCNSTIFCGSGGCQAYAEGGDGPKQYSCGGYGQGKAVMLATGWNEAVLAESGWSGTQYGEPSCCYRTWGPSKGGAPGKKGPEQAGDGTDGGDGISGKHGKGGISGAPPKGLTAEGLSSGPGGSGGIGGDGCGGGGGGQGDNYDSWLECEQLGGGGGGGGSGGSGGSGGKGGGGSGSSVGILMHAASGSVVDCVVTAGKGGKGGAGGAGGKGAPGGKGGVGGPGLAKSGAGGDGGDGGKGGGAGGGGGGGGGDSVAVATTSGYLVEVVNSVLLSGPPGGGGKGGSGGVPNGKPGANGIAGKSALVWKYWSW